MASDFTFDLQEHLGMISEDKSGYSKQVNIAAWGSGPAKVDIRSFNSEGRPLKGITLNRDEAAKLKEILNRHF